ncbi:hypothetical protein [Neobacillus kokaensis]|uniref:Uncharacterized protein n=1 Tax=Neobacillus kokaensis TaxID=2759023 RepID=A0ABQ3N877_9BACI|nr:hypothetical protein [Neobacillus kokaensis]GHH99717.1 hypothetical protein AM1BK_32600 [Neobacillus kokaensis]
MKIKIGNNNKIKNSVIGSQTSHQESNKKSFGERHPILISVIITFLFGFLFLFSFWDSIVKYIENIFK